MKEFTLPNSFNGKHWEACLTRHANVYRPYYMSPNNKDGSTLQHKFLYTTAKALYKGIKIKDNEHKFTERL